MDPIFNDASVNIYQNAQNLRERQTYLPAASKVMISILLKPLVFTLNIVTTLSIQFLLILTK